ncbi:MAG: methyltransferase domain-containing protein [Geminocystis sp.]|nr:methyltransferase domain-containing protein [Geminocystis sp.]
MKLAHMFDSVLINLHEKFRYLSHMTNQPIKILDVGWGNKSPSLTERFFPCSEYHGIDREIYNLTEYDLRIMDKFYNKDLNEDDLSDIPDEYFDYVVVCHVLQHTYDPCSLLEQLTREVKSGGYIIRVFFLTKYVWHSPLL